jgi:hypothetical protein
MSSDSSAIAAARDSLLSLAKSSSKRQPETTLAEQFEKLANLVPASSPMVRYPDTDSHAGFATSESRSADLTEKLLKDASEFFNKASQSNMSDFAIALTISVFHGAWKHGTA